MEAMGRHTGTGYSRLYSISSSSSSGTVVSTGYTSNGSRRSSTISSSGTVASHFDNRKMDDATALEEMAKEKMKQIKILVEKFITAVPSTSSENNYRVIDRWLTHDLGVGWLLHDDADAGNVRKHTSDNNVWSWIQAVDKITEIVRFMESLSPDDRSSTIGLHSVCEEEEEEEEPEGGGNNIRLIEIAAKLLPSFLKKKLKKIDGNNGASIMRQKNSGASIPDLFQFAQFIQQAILKLLTFIDVIAAPYAEMSTAQVEALLINFVPQQRSRWSLEAPPRRHDMLSTLLRVHAALSDALSAIQWLLRSPSPEGVERIQGEVVSLLSSKERKMREAIWSTMEQIRTRLLELTEDDQTPHQEGSSDIHKATWCVMRYISFLQFNYLQLRRSSRYSHYSLVNAVVNEAVSIGLYVPQITQVPPLTSLFVEMASCVEEKLASKSESSFQDKALRFLFLLNNSYYILEHKEDLRANSLQVLATAFTHKVEGYMESYIQISWAPMFSCLYNPMPQYFGSKHSQLSRFESEFQKVYTTQKLWKVPDPKLRKTLRKAITEKLIPDYKKYIEDSKVTTPKFSPQEMEKMLQELFEG